MKVLKNILKAILLRWAILSPVALFMAVLFGFVSEHINGTFQPGFIISLAVYLVFSFVYSAIREISEYLIENQNK